MRFPTDVTLLIGAGADPRLEQVWREEDLPVLPYGLVLDRLERQLEAIGTATVVVSGAQGFETAALAASLGYRTFLIGGSSPPVGVRLASVSEALEAGRGARARERWKVARANTRN